jgi:hypothetical protein
MRRKKDGAGRQDEEMDRNGEMTMNKDTFVTHLHHKKDRDTMERGEQTSRLARKKSLNRNKNDDGCINDNNRRGGIKILPQESSQPSPVQ